MVTLHNVKKGRFCRWQRTILQIVIDEPVFDEKRR
jgi:hypothetical protein